MIGDWDFNYWERKNRWIAELGLENINPRRARQLSDEEEAATAKEEVQQREKEEGGTQR